MAVCRPEPEPITDEPPIAPARASSSTADPGADAAEMGDREIDEHRPPRQPVGATRHQDHRGRDQRHQLPAGEERDRVARAEHRPPAQAPAPRSSTPIARPRRDGSRYPRENTSAGSGDQPERAQEEAAQPVDAEPRPQRAREPVARASTRARAARIRPHSDEHAPAACTARPNRNVARGAVSTPPSPSAPSPTTRSGADQRFSSSSRIDCCSASCRVMIARPAASRSNTRSSSTR